MYIITWHGTFVALQPGENALIQATFGINSNGIRPLPILVEIDELCASSETYFPALDLPHLLSHPTAFEEATMIVANGSRHVHFVKDDLYWAAEPSGNLIRNREEAGVWETFFLVTDIEFRVLSKLFSNDWVDDDEQFIPAGEMKLTAGFLIFIKGLEIKLDAFLAASCTSAIPTFTTSSERGFDAKKQIILRGYVDNPLIISLPDAYSRDMRNAKLEVHRGNFHSALRLFEEMETIHGDGRELQFYQGYARRGSSPPVSSYDGILWRKPFTWEQDWLNYILPDLPLIDPGEHVEGLSNRQIIIVDGDITEEKSRFYYEAYKGGCQIMLVHLSDEDFRDDHQVYRWCKSVFRNYYSPILHNGNRNRQKVSYFALGYKSGFSDGSSPLDLRCRNYTWSFAGDPNKSTRLPMLKAMRAVGGGYEHLTSGFDSGDALGVDTYRDMMRRSLFVPCPAGWISLDSFRVYEALEAGCIPIVERRPNFNYFAEAFGQCPFPVILDWEDVIPLIRDLQEQKLTHKLLEDCSVWWSRYKSQIRERFKNEVTAL